MTAGEPVLRRRKKLPDPDGLALTDRRLSQRLPACTIVDLLTDTAHWLTGTAAFGPLSGVESRLGSPRHRDVTTTFCYGCYLGPSQTSPSITNRDRFQVADVNQRHITEPTRLEAIVGVINRDHRVRLPKRWGSGQRAAADGPPGDVYAQNLLSEYHSREGGWGGIGDYHGSDTYIALGSSFMACGVWEAIPILDGLRETRSESRPDPLPADTPGPSETVFGLADLLAIQRMPRLRHWQHLTLYAPTEPRPVAPIEPLRELLHDTVDGTLIETHGPDMLRVAISISQGPVRSSTILGNLGPERRKTKRYVAFTELGRVLRTMLLRRFMNDDELRRTITAATPIAEAWNGLIPWVAWGGAAVVRQHNREEQRTIIRDHHLVANLVVCHNVVSMTRGLQALVDEGDLVTAAIIARLSPYKTEPINRLGHYERRFDHVPPPVTEELRLSPARSTREVERG